MVILRNPQIGKSEVQPAGNSSVSEVFPQHGQRSTEYGKCKPDQLPLNSDITNPELEALLYPGRNKTESIYKEPDYAYIHKELTKPGVTLTLLW